MESHCGRFLLVYNGELYNFPELRAELTAAQHRVEGASDTRVLLEACAAWGVDATLPKLRGMFAFALWDRRERRLVLARDRLGIKPLYWGWLGSTFAFASQLKALRTHPSWEGAIDRDALTAYLRFGYVPRDLSIFRGAAKLLPGHTLAVEATGETRQGCYWSAEALLRPTPSDAQALDHEVATDALEECLRDSIRRHMLSDVPVGAFLSGGIDSSTVVALMQAESARPVRTFSIGSLDPFYDESRHAAAVARHLGTDHTELIVDAESAFAVVPRLAEIYDEPFGDASQIPTFLVSQLARREVTVALSGDGGDELFCGYNRHLLAERYWPWLTRVPRRWRRVAGWLLRQPSPRRWDRFVARSTRLKNLGLFGDRLHKLGRVLGATGADELYKSLISQWDHPEDLVLGGREPNLLGALGSGVFGQSAAERLALLDLLSYLPEDILTKVDRASMAVSLEARVPLLDPSVVEHVTRLPSDLKLRRGQTKWLLRQVLYRHVPQALVDRPKMGFGIPVDAWLRGPLRSWAEELLEPSAMRQVGLLDPRPIQERWREHLSGRRNWQYALWTVLMFEQWRRAGTGRLS